MKKQASPAPTPRAAALSQSASRFSAGATSAWQRIVGNSPRLAANRTPGAVRVAVPQVPPAAPGVSRVALEPQRAAGLVAPATELETVRQVGWREADQAVGVSAKRKYSVFGIGFGPKVPVFETEKVKLPVYQETNRNKRYYAVVEAADVARIKREGLQVESGEGTGPKTVEQFNRRGHVCFFGSEASAYRYAKVNGKDNYAVVEFVMPEYQGFTPDSALGPEAAKAGKTQLLRTAHHIPAQSIRGTKISAVAKETAN